MHDLTATRILGILCHLAASGLIALGDKGYAGAGDPVIPPAASELDIEAVTCGLAR